VRAWLSNQLRLGHAFSVTAAITKLRFLGMVLILQRLTRRFGSPKILNNNAKIEIN
jgi:hypothetical protein